ncbi:MAG: carotenoid biosynthesis protein [Chitinophagia bacterium]|nr:carotenoid biosynthesis protein [Chitinophagia bacterium]
MARGISMPRTTWPTSSINRLKTATAAAIVIHVAGAIGILLGAEWFVRMTPVNLLVMLLFALWTEREPSRNLLTYFATAWMVGMASEIVGTHTGILFGNYAYGTVLGPGILGVPLLIGCNWFLTLRASSGIAARLVSALKRGEAGMDDPRDTSRTQWAIPLTGALLATFFDWVMEPVAVKLGYWTWFGDGSIPVRNYLTWFLIGWLLLHLAARLRISDDNRFPARLYLIQLVFFILLRWQS